MTSNDVVADIEAAALDESVPLASALRKCLSLGSRAGSAVLREWATRELQGYALDDPLPPYRTVGAPLKIDGIAGAFHATGHRISPGVLPDVVQEHVSEDVPFRQGIGELEAVVRDATARGVGSVKMSPPHGADVARMMNHEGRVAFKVLSIYWDVSTSAIHGILDHVRTILVQLVAEMRRDAGRGGPVPPADVVTNAVNVAVYGGRRPVVNVVAASAPSGTAIASSAPDEQPGHGWRRWQRVGAFVVGTFTIIGAVAAVVAILD